MITKIVFKVGLICFLLLFSTSLYAGVYLTEEEALTSAFPQADEIKKKRVIILDEQAEKIESRLRIKGAKRTFTYYEGIEGARTQGYAVIKTAFSKLSFFTFMVVIDSVRVIKQVEILSYWELRGTEIRQKRFLEQFKGKTIQDQLRLNSDIDAITGATISCQAITNGVREILTYLDVLLPGETGKKKKTTLAAPKKILWHTSLNEGLEMAKKEQNPLMVDFYADWCGWCKKLDKVTYADQEVIRLSASFVSAKVNTDADRVSPGKYGVRGLPTIIFFNPSGEVIERVVGYLGPAKFAAIMKKVLDYSDR